MIDRAQIGKTWPPHKVEVEKGRLRFFAKAIGERNPIYTDESAARAAGHPSLPVPPTFLFSLEGEGPGVIDRLVELGLDLRRLLHGEQSFRYHEIAHAGDVLTFESRVTDIFEKKGGALEFIVKETAVRNQAGRMIAELRSVLVQRNG